jgi:hypothetical protein
MQFIDIFNFKKYFRRKGDNGPAKIGHVNSLVPIIVEGNPNTLGIVPSFIGQTAVHTNNAIYVAYNATSWAQVWLD